MSKATLQTENETLHLIPGGILCIADRQTYTHTHTHTQTNTCMHAHIKQSLQQLSPSKPTLGGLWVTQALEPCARQIFLRQH